MKTRMPVRWQHCYRGGDVTVRGHNDPDEIRAWEGAHCDFLIASAVRRDDGWYPGPSDAPLDAADHNRRFDSARAAIEHVAEGLGLELVEAVCRCGTNDECD